MMADSTNAQARPTPHVPVHGTVPEMALLAAIVESSDDAIVSKTLDGIIQSWNAGAQRIFGYAPDEVIGRPITVIIPPELHDEERQILRKLRRGERIDHFDTVRVAKDGHRIPISLTVSPVRNAEGVIIGASKVARDISDRKLAEQTQLESERRLAAEALALAQLNERSARLWRSRTQQEGLEELLSGAVELLQADAGLLHLIDTRTGVLTLASHRGLDAEVLEAFRTISLETSRETLSAGECIAIEDIAMDPSGIEPFRSIAESALCRSLWLMPLLGPKGAPFGAIVALFRRPRRTPEQHSGRLALYIRQGSDFLQRCDMAQRLRQREEALREADQRKNEFLALLAHELRNPLAPIRYALAAARKSKRTPEQQQKAEDMIERQVAHMSRLLDDLLDVSRITRGTLELKRSTAELGGIIATAIEAARPLIESKLHALALDLPTEPVHLEADPVRLAQVFSNLLINAAKYTDAGGHIELAARREGEELLVSVRDDGIGIAPDMIPRLFTLFVQGCSSIGRSEGGLGVGLALARGIVSLHGGRIEVQSEGIGCGTTFKVQLPIGSVAPNTETRAPRSAGTLARRLNILVVDDNRDAADTFAALLELSGHEVRTAHTGAFALELAERLRPDALLLDIGLPDLSGFELARRIRASEWGRDCMLVAVSGWGQQEDKRRAAKAGFDRHLTKPISAEVVEDLLETLGRGMASRRTRRQERLPIG